MTRVCLALLVALFAGAPCLAQDSDPATTRRLRDVEFGVRLFGGDGDLARAQRFEDRRDGLTLDHLRYERSSGGWVVEAAVDRAGYQDQRYRATMGRYGRFRASVEWHQIPLFYGADLQSPYRVSGGRFLLDDARQGAVQAGAGTVAALFADDLTGVALRSRRDVGRASLRLAVTPQLDLRVAFTRTHRTGAQPYGASFGFGNAVELAVPVNQRVSDLATAVEWHRGTGMARLAYDGSWFSNAVDVLTWDNPLRLTDAVSSAGDGPSLGRLALWPDSSSHGVSASGSVGLPARTRAFASVSLSTWLQDAALLPHTVNTAIPPVALPRATAEGDARVVSMLYRVTTRPTPRLWVNGQVRMYELDNRTPPFAVGTYVRLDGAPAASATGGSRPFGYSRQFLDVDASWSLARFTALRAGYGRERDDRTFRFLDTTVEEVLRASIDGTGFTWGSLRLQYDHAVRTGEGFSEEAFSEIGEQVSLRQFDISDRVRDRVTAMVQVSPRSWLGLNAQVSEAREARPDAALGLQETGLRAVVIGVDLTLAAPVVASASWGHEQYDTLQRSRQANPGPQFDDVTRDWSTDVREGVHTVDAALEVRAPADTTVRAAWDMVDGAARYTYLLPAVSSLPPPAQLPPVVNRLQHLRLDVRRGLGPQLAVALGYRYDAYDVDDFALSPGTLDTPLLPGLVQLGSQWRSYRAHGASARIIWHW
ncbi:MAG: MtrB/PioB family outer membrane beta-barrel protein [Vicinamibacterales bacterium]